MDDTAVTFAAPWSASLKWITWVSTALIGSVACFGALVTPGGMGSAALWGWQIPMIGAPIACIVIAMFFAVRGYELTPQALYILRPGWRTRIDLAALTGAEADPQAMRRSIRTFGNGGLFVFAGLFHNKTLGHYRAWATDPKRAVVLKLGKKTYIVTPDDPQAFVTALGF